MKCANLSCDHGVASGHARFRAGPKGKPFQGFCHEHAPKRGGKILTVDRVPVDKRGAIR